MSQAHCNRSALPWLPRNKDGFPTNQNTHEIMENGDKGDKGYKGDKGDKGGNGDKGVKGDKGDKEPYDHDAIYDFEWEPTNKCNVL
jgi:hypothetical protein